MVLAEVVEGYKMSFSQIKNMDIIPNSSAIFGLVVWM
jgi:hypothetical protein